MDGELKKYIKEEVEFVEKHPLLPYVHRESCGSCTHSRDFQNDSSLHVKCVKLITIVRDWNFCNFHVPRGVGVLRMWEE